MVCVMINCDIIIFWHAWYLAILCCIDLYMCCVLNIELFHIHGTRLIRTDINIKTSILVLVAT